MSQERTQGPIRYNVATGKLTFGDYHYKPDVEGRERSNTPISSFLNHVL